VLVALVSFLPVLTLFGHFLISVVGLYEFASAHDLKVSPGAVPRLALGWIPYQLLVSYASLRAVLRHLRGISNWEKTQHIGAHRELADDQGEELGLEPSRALFQQGAGESAAGG
jgi:glycosyltransferase XagB